MTNTNTPTTTRKTKPYVRAVLTTLAMLASLLVASGVAFAATTTIANSALIQIADDGPANPYPSQISVQNLSGAISDVNVKLNGYDHGFADDVGVLLVGPKGQKALLMSDVGGAQSPFDPATGLFEADLTLDDEASNSLPDDGQIAPGAYKPAQGTITSVTGDCAAPANLPAPAPAGPYATNLSAFDGTDPNGTWGLYVIDDCAFQSGEIQDGWSLQITTGSTDPQSDTTSPRVTSTTPAAGATGVPPTANVKATYSEDMQAPTINGTTFELFKKASTTKLAAKVSYAATAHRATLDPTNSLKRGATYKAVVTTGAKDLAGNRLDQDPSVSGLQPKQWSFTVR